MLTPKLYRQLGEILLQETNTQIPDYSAYLTETLSGRPIQLGEHFRISRGGRLEANRPSGLKAFPVRLQTRAVIRGVTRAAQVGIPVGSATKEWLQSALRAPDFQREAEECLRNRPNNG
jgi:hypothetical protein